MKRGIFISLEGSEGCGKSTQIERLVQTFTQKGIAFLHVREPGGTALGEKIRDLLKHGGESISIFRETECLLFAASRAQLVRELIGPALAQGVVVVSDRFLDSSVVYQGAARGVPRKVVDSINHFAVGECIPDITFLLDMESELALRRAVKRRSPSDPCDRMEEEPLMFYEKVRQAYLESAHTAPGRFQVLDATLPIEELAQTIYKILETRFHGIFC